MTLFAQNNGFLGADITYTCDSAYSYTFKTVFYKKCDGDALPNPSSITKIVNQTTGYAYAVNMQLQGIEDITMVCPDSSKPCGGGSNLAGQEAHTYICKINIMDANFVHLFDSNNCILRFEVGFCCRDDTAATGYSGNFYTYSSLNFCLAPSNSSPQFILPPLVELMCYTSNYLSVDGFDFMDYDSLSYSIVRPMNEKNFEIPIPENKRLFWPFETYLPSMFIPPSPYTNPSANPPIGLYLNKLTGQIIFYPTKCDEKSVVVFQIEEWRKDENGKAHLIGVTRRDLICHIMPNNGNRSLFVNGVSHRLIEQPNTKNCFNFPVVENPYKTQTQTFYDSIKIIETPLPSGVTLTYEDGFHYLNTVVEVCIDVDKIDYRVSETNYLNVPILAIDNYCPKSSWTANVVTFAFDPLIFRGTIAGNVIIDSNANCQKDSNEQNSGIQRTLKITGKNFQHIIKTQANGQFSVDLKKGKYFIELLPHPYFIDDCSTDSILITPDSIFSINLYSRFKPGVGGYVYRDSGNCARDGFSLPIQNQIVSVDSDKHIGITESSGFYFIPLDSGNHKISLFNDTSLFQSICHDTISVVLKAGEANLDNHFLNFAKPVNDLEVNIVFNVGSTVRRGSDFWGNVIVKNNGTKPVTNKKVALLVDNTLPNLSKSNSALSHVYDSIYHIEVGNLAIYQQKTFKVYFNKNLNYAAGDTISIEVEMDTTNDIKKENNHRKINLRVVAAKDPNIKTCLPDSVFTSIDRQLTYTVQFQNEGTDYAQDIVVRDTLSDDFDLSTLKMLGSSHNFRYTLTNNELWVYFDNIKLPSKKTDSINSMGSFSFSIALKDRIFYEKQVQNRVGIYFDYEDVVLTNYQINHFKSPFEFYKIPEKIYCQSDTLKLPFLARFVTPMGNVYVLEVADSINFEGFHAIDSLPSQKQFEVFKIAVGKFFTNSGKYSFRLKSTPSAAQSFESSYLANVEMEIMKPTKILVSNAAICAGETLEIQASNNYFHNGLYQNENQIYSGNSTYTTVQNLKNGDKLFYKHISQNGCKNYSDTVKILVDEWPQADFDHHPAATDELLIEFENQSTNADSSFWKFGQNADEVWNNSPVVSQRFDHPGYYLVQLVAKTQHGCVDTLVKRIMVESDFNFFIPNTFSPGRTDGLNDHFVVVPSEYIKSIDFQLINRLGQTVVQSNNPNRLIDKELMPGIYMYKSKIIDLNGREYEYEGVVHIW
ncbi:MAG: hypothetical protein H6607_02590 [Flavobacteriales bacterium]|nr:hypothetical protein [Flavobacteriales bacterium]